MVSLISTNQRATSSGKNAVVYVSFFLHKATLVSAGATLLLQWSEMGILGPIMMRMLLLSHWVLHRRQVFAHVWNQDTRLTYFWSVKEWELFRLIYDNFQSFRKFWWISLSFSSCDGVSPRYGYLYTQKLFLLAHPCTCLCSIE